MPFKFILKRFEVVFWCLEWECCTFWKIDGNSFKSTNTVLTCTSVCTLVYPLCFLLKGTWNSHTTHSATPVKDLSLSLFNAWKTTFLSLICHRKIQSVYVSGWDGFRHSLGIPIWGEYWNAYMSAVCLDLQTSGTLGRGTVTHATWVNYIPRLVTQCRCFTSTLVGEKFTSKTNGSDTR